MRPLALALAVAAVLVAAPRLVLIFLEADSLQPSAAVRAALLGSSGAALALVLTGGGAYLVHAIVRVRRFQGLLFALWLVILTCIAALVTPRLVAGLEDASTPLARVLETPTQRWGWSAIAVLAAELVATGCVLAYAAQHQHHEHLTELLAEIEQLGQQRNQLQQQLLKARQHIEEHQQHLREQQPGEEQHLPDGEQQQLPDGQQQHLPDREQQQLSARRPRGAAAPRRAAAARTNGSSSTPPASQRIPCRFGCGYVAHSIAAERGHLASCPKHPKFAQEPSDAPQES